MPQLPLAYSDEQYNEVWRPIRQFYDIQAAHDPEEGEIYKQMGVELDKAFVNPQRRDRAVRAALAAWKVWDADNGSPYGGVIQRIEQRLQQLPREYTAAQDVYYGARPKMEEGEQGEQPTGEYTAPVAPQHWYAPWSSAAEDITAGSQQYAGERATRAAQLYGEDVGAPGVRQEALSNLARLSQQQFPAAGGQDVYQQPGAVGDIASVAWLRAVQGSPVSLFGEGATQQVAAMPIQMAHWGMPSDEAWQQLQESVARLTPMQEAVATGLGVPAGFAGGWQVAGAAQAGALRGAARAVPAVGKAIGGLQAAQRGFQGMQMGEYAAPGLMGRLGAQMSREAGALSELGTKAALNTPIIGGFMGAEALAPFLTTGQMGEISMTQPFQFGMPPGTDIPFVPQGMEQVQIPSALAMPLAFGRAGEYARGERGVLRGPGRRATTAAPSTPTAAPTPAAPAVRPVRRPYTKPAVEEQPAGAAVFRPGGGVVMEDAARQEMFKRAVQSVREGKPFTLEQELRPAEEVRARLGREPELFKEEILDKIGDNVWRAQRTEEITLRMQRGKATPQDIFDRYTIRAYDDLVTTQAAGMAKGPMVDFRNVEPAVVQQLVELARNPLDPRTGKERPEALWAHKNLLAGAMGTLPTRKGGAAKGAAPTAAPAPSGDFSQLTQEQLMNEIAKADRVVKQADKMRTTPNAWPEASVKKWQDRLAALRAEESKRGGGTGVPPAAAPPVTGGPPPIVGGPPAPPAAAPLARQGIQPTALDELGEGGVRVGEVALKQYMDEAHERDEARRQHEKDMQQQLELITKGPPGIPQVTPPPPLHPDVVTRLMELPKDYGPSMEEYTEFVTALPEGQLYDLLAAIGNEINVRAGDITLDEALRKPPGAAGARATEVEAVGVEIPRLDIGVRRVLQARRIGMDSFIGLGEAKEPRSQLALTALRSAWSNTLKKAGATPKMISLGPRAKVVERLEKRGKLTPFAVRKWLGPPAERNTIPVTLLPDVARSIHEQAGRMEGDARNTLSDLAERVRGRYDAEVTRASKVRLPSTSFAEATGASEVIFTQGAARGAHGAVRSTFPEDAEKMESLRNKRRVLEDLLGVRAWDEQRPTVWVELPREVDPATREPTGINTYEEAFALALPGNELVPLRGEPIKVSASANPFTLYNPSTRSFELKMEGGNVAVVLLQDVFGARITRDNLAATPEQVEAVLDVYVPELRPERADYRQSQQLKGVVYPRKGGLPKEAAAKLRDILRGQPNQFISTLVGYLSPTQGTRGGKQRTFDPFVGAHSTRYRALVTVARNVLWGRATGITPFVERAPLPTLKEVAGVGAEQQRFLAAEETSATRPMMPPPRVGAGRAVRATDIKRLNALGLAYVRDPSRARLDALRNGVAELVASLDADSRAAIPEGIRDWQYSPEFEQHRSSAYVVRGYDPGAGEVHEMTDSEVVDTVVSEAMLVGGATKAWMDAGAKVEEWHKFVGTKAPEVPLQQEQPVIQTEEGAIPAAESVPAPPTGREPLVARGVYRTGASPRPQLRRGEERTWDELRRVVEVAMDKVPEHIAPNDHRLLAALEYLRGVTTGGREWNQWLANNLFSDLYTTLRSKGVKVYGEFKQIVEQPSTQPRFRLADLLFPREAAKELATPAGKRVGEEVPALPAARQVIVAPTMSVDWLAAEVARHYAAQGAAEPLPGRPLPQATAALRQLADDILNLRARGTATQHTVRTEVRRGRRMVPVARKIPTTVVPFKDLAPLIKRAGDMGIGRVNRSSLYALATQYLPKAGEGKVVDKIAEKMAAVLMGYKPVEDITPTERKLLVDEGLVEDAGIFDDLEEEGGMFVDVPEKDVGRPIPRELPPPTSEGASVEQLLDEADDIRPERRVDIERRTAISREAMRRFIDERRARIEAGESELSVDLDTAAMWNRVHELERQVSFEREPVVPRTPQARTENEQLKQEVEQLRTQLEKHRSTGSDPVLEHLTRLAQGGTKITERFIMHNFNIGSTLAQQYMEQLRAKGVVQ